MVDEVPGFGVSVRYPRDGRAVVAVSGELDLSGAGKLHSTLLEAGASQVVVLDLHACSFCDSSGLRSILDAARLAHLAGTSFRVAGVGPNVARIFDLAGLGTYLNLFPDVETALKDPEEP